MEFYFPTSAEVTMNLIGYSYSDWVVELMILESHLDFFSIWGHVFFNWSSRKQETTSQSTVEAEYIVAASAVNQVMWLKKMMKDIVHEQAKATKIMCEKNSAVSI